MALRQNTQPARPRPTRSADAGAEPQAPVKPGQIKGLGAVVIRNEFYRDGYRVLQSIAVMQAIMILVLILIMFYVVHIHQPENRYFATTEDGRLVPMVALNEPNLSTPALTSWAAQSATEVMTFGFHDYRRRLQESSRNFTRSGWDSFTKALQKARIIELVEQQQQVVTAAPDSAPVVVSEGLVLGRYQWVIEVPLTVNYQSTGGSRTDRLLIRMLIVRVPRLESPSGVGIEQWVATPRGQ
jgi:intracellular multiplication protein IcmL